MHAPKDDPYHRAQWREPYPDDELAQLAELVAECDARAASSSPTRSRPGLDDLTTRATPTSRRCSRSASRCGRSACGTFQLLWDDIEHDHARDEASGRADGARMPIRTASREAVAQDGAARRLPDGLRRHRRHAVPRGFAAEPLDPDDRRLLDRARRSSRTRSRARSSTWRSARFAGHELLLWDNYPVNDLATGERSSSGRSAAATRGSSTAAARADRERDGAGGPVEARARDGRRLARATRAATTRVASFERGAARLRRRGASRRSRPRPANVEPPPTTCGARRGARARRRRGDRRGAAGAVRVTDVVVYGATAAGVAAAVGAAEAGAHRHARRAGRRTSAAWSPAGSAGRTSATRACSAASRAASTRAVAEHYGAPLWGVKGPEPHVAERILDGLLDGVDVASATTELPDAAVYVDASYEGDLLPRFGVPLSRSAASRARLYGERWAGRQPAYAARQAQLPRARLAVRRRRLAAAVHPRARARRRAAGRSTARRGRRRAAGVQLPRLPDRPRREPPPVRAAGRLRPRRVRAAAPLPRARPTAPRATCSASNPTCCRTASATSTRSGRSR